MERFDIKLDVLFYMLQRILYWVIFALCMIVAYLFVLLEESSPLISISSIFIILSLYAAGRIYSYKKLEYKGLEIITRYSELRKGDEGANANTTTNKSDEAV